MSETIPFFRPAIGTDEIAEVTATLRSGWVANGARARQFEEAFARAVDAPAAVAVASGTVALHLALLALGIGPADEVITSSVTCVATINAIEVTGATPVVVDVTADTLNMDPGQVESAIGPRTAALLVVHYAGHPADVDTLAAIARRHGLAIVDDAAHALGAVHNGRPIGSTATLTAFSFSATKLITTGEGGMLVGAADLVERARTLASLGDAAALPGLKLVMSDVTAGLGIIQLSRLSQFRRRRREIADYYRVELAQVLEIELPIERPEVSHAWHLYTVRIRRDQVSIDRDDIVARINADGGAAARQFRPVHHEPRLARRYAEHPPTLPVCEAELARNLSLPLYPALSAEAARRVVGALRRTMTTHAVQPR